KRLSRRRRAVGFLLSVRLGCDQRAKQQCAEEANRQSSHGMTPGRRGVVVDGGNGVGRAVLIRTSMGASRRSVKKRQVLSQSLAVHPPILSAARARVGLIDRSKLGSIDFGVVGPTRARATCGRTAPHESFRGL